MRAFLGKRGRAGRMLGIVTSVVIGATAVLVATASPAHAVVPVPTGRSGTADISDDRILNESFLYQLLTPALRVAAKPQIQSLVRSMVGRMYDGDTNVLFSDLVQEAEWSGIIGDYDQDWLEMKYALEPFGNVNGYPYEPQIYIPNYEYGVWPTATVEMAVAPANEDIESVPGYFLDQWGYLQLTASPIDDWYIENYEVWVLSVSSRVQETPPVLHSTEVITPKSGPTPGLDVICNSTGLRNNMAWEYLQRWRVPNIRSFGGALSGRTHMRLLVITRDGGVVKRATMDKVARRHIDLWQVVDLFITTWDRAIYGDAMVYQWVELDGGKKTKTLTINVPIEGGGSISSQVQVQEDDDDGGATPVLFNESTYTTYDTGTVQFNPCSVGGEGGTGYENLGCTALASASSTHEDARLRKANDCNTTTALNQGWVNRRGTDVRTSLQWIQLDFGVNRTVVRAVIYTSTGYAIRAFDIQVWTGSSYMTVGSVTNNTSLVIHVNFSTGPYSTRLVRLVGRSGPLHQAHYARVNEFEVYGA